MNKLPKLDDAAVPTLTKTGGNQLLEPGTKLPRAQLEALVLIDGHITVAQLVKRAKSVTPDELRASLKELVNKGFVNVGADSDYGTIDPGDFFTFFTPKAEPSTSSEASEQTNAETDADVEFLRRNGYYVTMARGPADMRTRAEGRNLTVLIIDDDEDIRKLLQMFLKLEGFDTRSASNRDEIVAELCRPPLPDLVLLDVWLEDVNGFDVLAKIRQHQVLKGLPVIMLTGDATRGAVLKGLQGGADGFVTKPFEILPLVKAVKTVLGLDNKPKGP